MAIEENKFKDQLDYRYMTESDLEAVLEIERFLHFSLQLKRV